MMRNDSIFYRNTSQELLSIRDRQVSYEIIALGWWLLSKAPNLQQHLTTLHNPKLKLRAQMLAKLAAYARSNKYGAVAGSFLIPVHSAHDQQTCARSNMVL